MNWYEIVFIIVLVTYVGLWVADLVYAKDAAARKRILMDVVETSAVAIVFGSFLWWML